MGKKHPHKGGVYTNYWHIPGGGVNNGEDYLDALVREIREETGLSVPKKSMKLIDNTGKGKSEKTLKDTNETVMCEMSFWVYEIQLDSQANETHIQLNDDLVEFAWVKLCELKNYKLTPPSVKLFKKLCYLK